MKRTLIAIALTLSSASVFASSFQHETNLNYGWGKSSMRISTLTIYRISFT
ncbi:hypothetical protein [Alishewanella longhuensis]